MRRSDPLSIQIFVLPCDWLRWQAGVDYMTSHLKQSASERDRHVQNLQRLITTLRDLRHGKVTTVESSSSSSTSVARLHPLGSGGTNGNATDMDHEEINMPLTPRMVMQAITDSKTEIEVVLRELHLSILEKVLVYDPNEAATSTTLQHDGDNIAGNDSTTEPEAFGGQSVVSSNGKTTLSSREQQHGGTGGGGERSKKKPARPASPRPSSPRPGGKKRPPASASPRPRSPRASSSSSFSSLGAAQDLALTRGASDKSKGPQVRPSGSPRATRPPKRPTS